MPFKKQSYNWQRVRAGDIITFNYKSSRSPAKKNNCILVLNPRIPVTRKDGSSTFHLTGIKLKENNKIRVRFTSGIVRIFERLGEFKVVEYKDDIFSLDIKPTHLISEIKGVKVSGFNKITTSTLIRNNYRTYDYYQARKSPIYLDWIKISNKEKYKPKNIILEEKKEVKEIKEREISKEKDIKPVKTNKKPPKNIKK